MGKRYALLGAGFSRNWGAWLAPELVGELCGRVADDDDLVRRLTKDRNFEVFVRGLRRRCLRAAHRRLGGTRMPALALPWANGCDRANKLG